MLFYGEVYNTLQVGQNNLVLCDSPTFPEESVIVL